MGKLAKSECFEKYNLPDPAMSPVLKPMQGLALALAERIEASRYAQRYLPWTVDELLREAVEMEFVPYFWGDGASCGLDLLDLVKSMAVHYINPASIDPVNLSFRNWTIDDLAAAIGGKLYTSGTVGEWHFLPRNYAPLVEEARRIISLCTLTIPRIGYRDARRWGEGTTPEEALGNLGAWSEPELIEFSDFDFDCHRIGIGCRSEVSGEFYRFYSSQEYQTLHLIHSDFFDGDPVVTALLRETTQNSEDFESFGTAVSRGAVISGVQTGGDIFTYRPDFSACGTLLKCFYLDASFCYADFSNVFQFK